MLKACEMWFYRKTLKIKWTDKIKNKEVLNKMGVSRQLISEIRKRQLKI